MTGLRLGRWTRLLIAIAASGAMCLAIGTATASAATTDYVCPGCSTPGFYPDIQTAINAAGTGDTIYVEPGTYTQTIDVDKPLTIEGSGTGNTIIDADPATLTDQFTLDSGTITNFPIIYANATNVTIEDLTVDGLDDGTSVAGRFEGIADYDNNLTVNDVHVTGLSVPPPGSGQTGYGILAVNDAATGRAVTVTNTRVYDYQTNGITVDGNVDVNVDIAGDTLVGDGPVGNSSAGVDIDDLYWEADPPAGPTGNVSDNNVTGNVCTESGGDCGPDLLGDGYEAGDDNIGGDSAGVRLGNVSDVTVSGNDVADNDIGVWSTTATGDTTTISANTLAGNLYADALAGFGTSVLSGNTIGTGADSTAGLDGVLVAGYDADSTAANATVTANTITGTDAGVEVAVGETPNAPVPTAIVANNAITGNTQGIENKTSESVDAVDNWFGCNGGPGTTGCDTVTGTGASHVTTSPYLVLDVSALPSSIVPGATTTLLASIRQNSAGSAFPSGPFPSGLPVTFATTSGSADAGETLGNGQALSTLSGTGLGAATITATLDNQSATTSVTTANPASSSSSIAPNTVTVTVPAQVNPLIAFLSAGKLSLLASNPGSELTLTCIDGCSALVGGKILLHEKHGKHKTLTLSTSQLTVAAGGSSVYQVSLSSSQRSSIKHAVSATLTLNVSATDDMSGKTVTSSKSFSLTRS
jgi:hypothetical protein